MKFDDYDDGGQNHPCVPSSIATGNTKKVLVKQGTTKTVHKAIELICQYFFTTFNWHVNMEVEYLKLQYLSCILQTYIV